MKKFIIVILLVFANHFYAQKYELGEVTKEELLEKKHPADTSAVAAILFKKAKTTFTLSDEDGFFCNTEFLIKIKIYKKQGLDWANFEIPFYVGFDEVNDEMVTVSKAFTYNLVDGKIEKTKVTSEGKYVEKLNELWKTKLITFPNVKEGSIIELKYTIKSGYLTTLPEFKFQYDIPVNFMEYITKIPEFYIYKPMVTGNLDIQFKEKMEETSANFNERVGLAKQSRTISFRQIVSTYSMKDVPSFQKEDFVNSDNYCGKIEHELQIIRMPNEQPKKIATDWESVTKSIYNDSNFGKELNKNAYFSTTIDKIVEQTDTDEVKIKKVFNYIKGSMNWDGKNGYMTRKGVEVAFKEKTGNVAEINLMLTAMLRLAGLDAKPVLISTRENGLVLFPNRTKFNYLITAVVLDKKTILLDATNKNSTLNILPIRALNWYGRMINGDGTSSEVYLMPEFISTQNIKLNATVKPDGIIEGTVTEQYNDYNALYYRERYGKMATESYLEILEKNKKNTEISDFSVVGTNEIGKPIVETYSFKNTNAVEIIGNKMFFSPLLFYVQNENPFKSETREFPVDFIFPNSDEYKINITIPQGFVIESLPTNNQLNMKDNLVTVDYQVNAKNNTIQLTMFLSINSAIVSPDYYQELKSIFNDIVKKENEKIVLKKI
ncbi:MAG: DUF3857 domain-containing protein [Flavobacterium sp.]|nr:DUF3857 domain-containing protein [Flavobacterium sp.]